MYILYGDRENGFTLKLRALNHKIKEIKFLGEDRYGIVAKIMQM